MSARRQDPEVGLNLWKAHGLGNDYLVWMGEGPVDTALAIALCDRHRGPGADGVLQPVPSDRAEYGVRIWNPDGSIAEKSGNGLRIFARWLVDQRGAGRVFRVDTGHEVVTCKVGPEMVEVAMGAATIREDLNQLSVDATVLDIVALDVGNPHCVVFQQDELDTLPWRTWGRALETDPAFDNRTNVQVARVAGGAVEMRIWERGAGETSASGSSACAVVAAAVHTGLLAPGRHVVYMPGGTLLVDVTPGLQLTLTGPVSPVGMITLDPAWSYEPGA